MEDDADLVHLAVEEAAGDAGDFDLGVEHVLEGLEGSGVDDGVHAAALGRKLELDGAAVGAVDDFCGADLTGMLTSFESIAPRMSSSKPAGMGRGRAPWWSSAMLEETTMGRKLP